ncbi:MAG: hypothetical protein ACRDQ4_19085, partial [Pseudonocardiaceae bacterium]
MTLRISLDGNLLFLDQGLPQGPGKVLFRQIDAHRSLNERGDHDLVCSQCAEFDRRAARPAS